MDIEIRLFATLRQDRFKKALRDYEAASTVETIVDDLKIPVEDIAILLVNGRDGYLSTVLKEGDVVSIFPPVGGG
jgi:molybdopterin converting factor small subunit